MQDTFKNGLIQYGLEHNYIERSKDGNLKLVGSKNQNTNQDKVDLSIVDDGTMDTVVYDSISKKEFRYDSDRRFAFMNDEEFLKEIENEILEELWEISQ